MRRLSALLLALPPLLALNSCPRLSAQEPPAAGAPQASPVAPPAPRIEIPIEVVGKDGLPARDLKPADLTLLLDGAPTAVSGLTPWTGEWRIVIYVDRSISGSRTLRGAAGALASLARELAALGPVEVVVAEPEPRVFFAPSREPKRIDDALSRLWLQSEGRDDLRELRRRYLEEKEGDGDSAEKEEKKAGEAEGAATLALDAETRLVRGRLEALSEWLIAHRGEGPGLLFLVSDGFDVDPSAFYGGAKKGELDGLAARTAQSLAALGWTVYPLPMGEALLPDLTRMRPGGSRRAPIGGTITLGNRKKDQPPKAPPPPALKNPLEPLNWLAEASGGQVLIDPQALGGALARLKGRVALALPTSPAGRPVALALAPARAGLTVRAPRWQGSGLPAAVTAARAVRLGEGDEEGGGIEVLSAARIDQIGQSGPSGESDPAARRVSLEIKIQPRAEGRHKDLSVTVATTSGESLLFRQPLGAGEERGGGEVAYLLPLEVPAGVERLALVVETETGSPWGGSSVLLEGLEGPEGASTAAAPPDAAAETELAGGAAANRAQRVPAPAEGSQANAFEVRIVEPSGLRGVGSVEVEAEVRLPAKAAAMPGSPASPIDGQRVERVEFYWEEILAGTVYDPPYRHRVRVPAAHPLGTLRVEARLADGTTAEDSVVLNAPGVSARIDVRLVEVNVVVTDERGKPVRGLPREAFRLTEGGREQTLASFENTGDLPLTLALAIDSSASMFLKLPVVGRAVESLLAEGLSPRDRALLVQFDDAPRLVQPATRDLTLLTGALRSLRPDGGTGLWDAVRFSLSQLRGIGGRKALIVYSDGIDEGGKVSYAECLRAVRQSGLPVFLIVSNALAAAGQDGGFLSESIGERLKRLTEGVGGRVVFLGPDQDLPQVYQEILAELRSRYTLSFYPAEGAARRPGPIDVRLLGRRGLDLRVVQGSATSRR